ncbi:unnamed protein product [Lymnaea stagnalis]|uniref:Uncharacterized protein n=1 Tax=Lymnaea stagnalis TaxID=6523 RepID=A0AAV2HIN3_LYMST
MVDIFESLNSINTRLLGQDIAVLHCHETLAAFKMKLKRWHAKLEKGNSAPFTTAKCTH